MLSGLRYLYGRVDPIPPKIVNIVLTTTIKATVLFDWSKQ